MVEFVDGGVCAAKGFKASGIYAGFRKNPDKRDLSLICSDVNAACAGVYTTNKVKGAPIAVTKEHISDGYARCIVTNSGNANTCAPNGEQVAKDTCSLLAKELGIDASDVAVCSTGVIGEELDIEPFKTGIPELVSTLSVDGSEDCNEGIMTTDTKKKSVAVKTEIGGCECVIGGIAKGSGMINPNMATMLAFVTTDVNISPLMLQKAVKSDVVESFNQICVDGDTSTNDTFLVMANGQAGNSIIEEEGKDFDDFKAALAEVTKKLAKMMAGDGEGASKTITCEVKGASSDELARKISKTVISSNLLKAAIFGSDANWGRVLCAIGYTEGDFDASKIDVSMSSKKGEVIVCKGSRYAPHDEDEANNILNEEDILVSIDMNDGEGKASAWGCDLTYEYVRINGEYRS